MRETYKANKRRVTDLFWGKVFQGKGIDIGCGKDPITHDNLFPAIKECELYDARLGHPDAQFIHKHRALCSYDFVYSSHCLEHMVDPLVAVANWGKLVKLGGYLVFVVPDEDLYEQGVWPSNRNADHKKSFTIFKEDSWCPDSVNVLDLAKHLPNFKMIRISLEDKGYDYTLKNVDQTITGAECNIECVALKTKDDT